MEVILLFVNYYCLQDLFFYCWFNNVSVVDYVVSIFQCYVNEMGTHEWNGMEVIM